MQSLPDSCGTKTHPSDVQVEQPCRTDYLTKSHVLQIHQEDACKGHKCLDQKSKYLNPGAWQTEKEKKKT